MSIVVLEHLGSECWSAFEVGATAHPISVDASGMLCFVTRLGSAMEDCVGGLSRRCTWSKTGVKLKDPMESEIYASLSGSTTATMDGLRSGRWWAILQRRPPLGYLIRALNPRG
jgi:hypothetical protein